MRNPRSNTRSQLSSTRNQLKKSSDFSGDRRAALEVLKNAALKYTEGIGDLRADEYRINAFSTWFNAALGANIDKIYRASVA